MNHSHDNSLLFSLAELRAIEDARIAEEAEAERVAREAEREAREAAAEATRQEALRLETERADRERAMREAREEAERAAERRERLALEERERLARVAAEERIARERLAFTAPLQRESRRLPFALAGALAMACSILALVYVRASGELSESRSALAAANDRIDSLERDRDHFIGETDKVIAELRSELAKTQSALADALAPQTPTRPRADRRRDSRTRPTRPRTPPSTRSTAPPISLPTDCSGPLCGLKPPT